MMNTWAFLLVLRWMFIISFFVSIAAYVFFYSKKEYDITETKRRGCVIVAIICLFTALLLPKPVKPVASPKGRNIYPVHFAFRHEESNVKFV